MESSPVLTGNPCTTGEGQENPPGLCSPPARNVLPCQVVYRIAPRSRCGSRHGGEGGGAAVACDKHSGKENFRHRAAWRHLHKLCLEPQRDVSFSEVITEEAKKRGPGGWEVLAKLALAARSRAIRAAAWERGAGSSCSSDGVLKGTGVPSKRQTEGCPGGRCCRPLSWPGAEHPKEPLRTGCDGETGGGKAPERGGAGPIGAGTGGGGRTHVRAASLAGPPPCAPPEAVAAGQAAR